MKLRLLYLPVICVAAALAEPIAVAPNAIVENYVAATQVRDTSLRGASMEVEIDASLPRLKKFGRLHALRHISRLGRITYERLRWEGDGTIKHNVIARYLQAEVQGQSDTGSNLAVTPANYKFKYKGISEEEGRKAYVFQVTPRKKRVGLFRGEIWIDSQTYQRVRESGRLVKNPSIFLKKVEFVRKYQIRDGIPVPVQLQSVVDTRLVGKAELTVDYTNVSLDEPTSTLSLAGFDAQ